MALPLFPQDGAASKLGSAMLDLLTGNAVFYWIATWANPFWDVFFRILTDHGQTVLYFLIIAPLCWVGDRRRALVLFALLVISSYLNTYAKFFFDTPRPDPELVRVLDFRVHEEGSRSFPSGHAQNALVFWGYLAWWLRRSWGFAIGSFYIVGISFSRLYLGVHFPIDILGGLLLGGACLALTPRLERWAADDFALPWAARAALVALPLVSLLASGDRSLAALAGTVVGVALVVLWLPQRTPAIVDWRRGAMVIAAGIALEIVLLAGMGWATPTTPSPTFLACSAIVLWITSLWAYPVAVDLVLARRAAWETVRTENRGLRTENRGLRTED